MYIGYKPIKVVEKHWCLPSPPTLSGKWYLEDTSSNSIHSLESIFFSQAFSGKWKPFEKNPVKDFSSLDFSTLYTNCAQLKHSDGNLWEYIKLQAMNIPCAEGIFIFYFFLRVVIEGYCLGQNVLTTSIVLRKAEAMVRTLWFELHSS